MKSVITTAIALAAMIAVGPASADRIILAPTGSILGPGQFKLEGAISPGNNDNKIYWAGIGLKKIELNAVRFGAGQKMVGARDTDVVGMEVGLLPETILTPGVGVGVWDATDKTVDGRGYYLAVSKGVPLTKELPLPIRDIQLHVGYGMSGIKGAFVGAQAAIPFGLKVSAEYFQKKYDFALAWTAIPFLELKGQRLDGDTYYGIQFTSPIKL
jgi:hypothetical protein